jgi:hypothetical protein
MKQDQRPGKVRIFSSAGTDAGHPPRRRTDKPDGEANVVRLRTPAGTSARTSIRLRGNGALATPRRGSSFLSLLVPFLIGSALGGGCIAALGLFGASGL